MMLTEDIVPCHVLVIGSGGAGVRAAIEAAKSGETILVSKTIAGKGGCTVMAEGGYNAVMCDADCTGDHFDDTIRGGAWLNDPELVRILVDEAPERMNDLISWGAVFDVTNECKIAQRPFGGQKFPRTCYAGDRTGHEMMLTLMEKLSQSGVSVMHETTVISLLKTGDRVSGAVALSAAGKPVVITADSVILATGGGTRIYDISTNSVSGTGDGFALGYMAGASLIDMEQVQFHPTGAVYPWDARGRLVTEAVRGEGGVLKNSLGERFMEKYDSERMELSTRDVVARAAETEIREGRGSEHNGVYLDVSHLPAEEIESRLPVMLAQFLMFGVDIRTEAMEVAPTAHHMMGGLKINSDCMTTVPGLYACGEVAGGVHGANRLGGNALADTQVFGKRAGEAAGKADHYENIVPEEQVKVILREIKGFFSGSVSPATVKQELRQAMWESAGVFRTGEGLKNCLETVEKLKNQDLKAVSERNLGECFTVKKMCITAALVLKSALIRPESRGAHLRTDIDQGFSPDESPYTHTFISLKESGIMQRDEA